MNGVARGLARLRDFRWDMYAQPLREMRLEMQIVYFAIHVPFGSGVTLNLPLLTMIKPLPSPDEQTALGSERVHR
ncbi:hypothetical protein MMAN_05900 [Mycobacterium mantenii]|uniref:Uncharacterized protein n=1 Tax=Mycobacterium mantenii TaxID=560555 RepID=A0A1X0FXA5_MYCNT|nr:hypothetical protein [Mycobacterium mantenii]MCV7242752.1 hypothetical protein [Mycobacterium mantenii]ORB06412.1 hypothetical protein BST30_10600 [Mycobacterium mantenii]BBY36456.1 hypothetical protein MMAN_05900 [Mycobacterium mantenii]